ncbi:MAG: membrane protein insertion efficiency factor YidD [Acidimicrobiales bacterium]
MPETCAPPGSHRPVTETPAGATVVQKALTGIVTTYQLFRIGRVSPCRFTPTCSQYALEALRLHGTRRGLRLTASRLLRCRPGGPFGADPVPE